LWNKEILLLGDSTLLVECGPMRMFIEASEHGIPRPDACRKAAEQAVGFLEEVAAVKHTLAAPAITTPEPEKGTLAHTMWEAGRIIGDPDLTPMAAVAGAMAGATADYLEDLGMTRVLVNNGGDLAIRLRGEEQVYVGIRPEVQGTAVSHRILVTPETSIRGVCTSGLGGRSFTRGIASAATVLASNTAYADAAATALGNATFVPSRSVVQRPADSLYPDTDLKHLDVTVSVGDLTQTEITLALGQAISKAEGLTDRGIIEGACLFVQGRMAATSALAAQLEALEPLS
jgi:ApbE superfamily uncharacterized protein (UPF0280 family)